jgi:hypothetical protein
MLVGQFAHQAPHTAPTRPRYQDLYTKRERRFENAPPTLTDREALAPKIEPHWH